MMSAVLCLACADDGPTDAPPPSPVGSYQLVRYDGAMLPAVVGEDRANPDRVLAGSLVLNADGSCSQSRTLLRTRDGVTTTEVDVVGCTYTVPTSDRLVIEYDDGRNYRMITWMGDQIAISDFFAPEEVIYRRLP
jgi:hypothetical protein